MAIGQTRSFREGLASVKAKLKQNPMQVHCVEKSNLFVEALFFVLFCFVPTCVSLS